MTAESQTFLTFIDTPPYRPPDGIGKRTPMERIDHMQALIDVEGRALDRELGRGRSQAFIYHLERELKELRRQLMESAGGV